jgi:hypothetical protein
MFRSGYWLLGRWRSVPIKLHFSIAVGLLFFGGFRWRPGFFLAYPCLVLLHELGHAVLVRRCRHRVVSVEVSGLGGVCRWSGNASPFEEALTAWGGVLAQFVAFCAAHAWLSVQPPESAFGWDVAWTFTHSNLWMIAFNLLPIAPLDGARAWGILRAFRERQPTSLPHGTWRDRSPTAQGAWFDKLQRGRRSGDRSREPTARQSQSASEVEANPDGPLSVEAQQAIDRLVKSVTGKGGITDKARDSKP